MSDQAQKLRELMLQFNNGDGLKKKTKVVTVTSGKGGVGKSNFTLNFSLALQKENCKVVILDADMGLANINVLMSSYPQHHLIEMIEKELKIWDVLVQGPHNIEFISGGSGFTKILNFNEYKIDYCFEQISELQGYSDMLIIDTGAGISRESLRFMLASDEIILITTPEPTALTDAYSVIKMVYSHNPEAKFKLVINRADSLKEAHIAANKITKVAQKFLTMNIEVLGHISDDTHVAKSVKKQEPFIISFPKCAAAEDVRHLAKKYLCKDASGVDTNENSIRGFLYKMKKLIKSK